MKRRILVPGIVRITASSYSLYRSCSRNFYLQSLLQMPASDFTGSPDQGLLVHEVLHDVHVNGSCHDREHVRSVLARNNADTKQMNDYIDGHRKRCPQSFDSQAHEIDRARFNRMPAPMFLASARIDALWVRDGVLDIRDYKTGGRRNEELRDDPSARLQAWVMARDAERRRLKLRLRYEYLSPDVDEDPEPWEPDADDLEAIGDELRSAVAAMHDEEWRGVADAELCKWCRYRSICRDSAVPGEPAWPVLASE